MKKLLLALVSIALTATFSIAAEVKLDKETQTDIARHRAMATAHEGAAKCLESGKKDEVCEKELQAACKGLAIGKFCGMKHEH
jgi:opacity protein-like surface antigen